MLTNQRKSAPKTMDICCKNVMTYQRVLTSPTKPSSPCKTRELDRCAWEIIVGLVSDDLNFKDHLY